MYCQVNIFMTFAKLVESVISNMPVLIVEDNPLIFMMMKATLNSGEIMNVINKKSSDDAIDFVKNNPEIAAYSLDFDLVDGNSLKFAKYLKDIGNDGYNVWIHSGNEDRRHEIQIYLPEAKLAINPEHIPQIINYLR